MTAACSDLSIANSDYDEPYKIAGMDSFQQSALKTSLPRRLKRPSMNLGWKTEDQDIEAGPLLRYWGA